MCIEHIAKKKKKKIGKQCSQGGTNETFEWKIIEITSTKCKKRKEVKQPFFYVSCHFYHASVFILIHGLYKSLIVSDSKSCRFCSVEYL